MICWYYVDTIATSFDKSRETRCNTCAIKQNRIVIGYTNVCHMSAILQHAIISVHVIYIRIATMYVDVFVDICTFFDNYNTMFNYNNISILNKTSQITLFSNKGTVN